MQESMDPAKQREGWADPRHTSPGSGSADTEGIVDITPDMLANPGALDDRIDFERGISYAPRLTLILILISILVFAVELAKGSLESEEAIIRAGALHQELVAAGQVWRLLSAMFLHGGFGHLIGNCIALYIVGMALEHAVGSRQSAVVYMISGLAGGMLSVLFQPGPSVGASGAIFGVMGAVIVVLYRNQSRWRVRDKRIGFVLLLWATYQLVTGWLTPLIDNFAHMGGLLAGAAMGVLVKPDIERIASFRDRQL